MKRLIRWIIAIVLFVIAFIIYTQVSTEQSEQVVDDFDNVESKMSGYYYFGYLDQREKLDPEAEKDYFYYMDNYFEDYYESMFPITRDVKELDENVEQFFESIGGLYLFSIPSKDVQNVKNGDYISFIVKSPIKETYPAMIDRIENVEIIHPRDSE